MGHDNRACDCDSRFESATDVVGCKTSDPINPLHYMQGGVDIFNLDDSTAKSGGEILLLRTLLSIASDKYKCKDSQLCSTWYDGCNCIIPYELWDVIYIHKEARKRR